MSICHPDRKHKALGFCRSCYDKQKYKPTGNTIGRPRTVISPGDNKRNYARTDNGKLTQKRADLKRRYKISYEEYTKLLERSNGKCELCGGAMIKEVIDHCHHTGHNRGLLHRGCNLYLGYYEKGVQGIVDTRCEEYLRRYGF
jgi:hypothetical protein